MRGLFAAALLVLTGCPKGSSTDAGAPDSGPTDAGGGTDAGNPDLGVPRSSHSLALSEDGQSLWVVNPESDSLSEIALGTGMLAHEYLLAAAPPAVDANGRYEPAVRPRSVALVDGKGKAYVAAESANAVLVVSMSTGVVQKSIPVGAEPVSVVATADGAFVYAVVHQAALIQKIDTTTDAVVATLPVGEHPWGVSLRADGSRLYVSHLLVNPGVTAIDLGAFSVSGFTPLADQPMDSSMSKLVPNGQVRGAYAAIPRPNDGTVWVAHLLLSNNTAQPQLDFQSTVFPTLSRLAPGGGPQMNRLLFRPSAVPTAVGSFTDSVSGPRDVAFTPDGKFALVAMAQSEDVMVFDATTGFETSLVRPTPSALLEGIVVNPAGTTAYLHGRASHNVTVLSVSPASGAVAVSGSPIECLAGPDPMPPNMREGMRLFYSSNSSQFPLTQNFWVACASCHLEGLSDDIVWKFKQGPRDTPSNAGGPINTGFLFRQAVRSSVVQYDETINVEQGGHFDPGNATQLPQLQAIADFANYAIPFPQNPNLFDPGSASLMNGKNLFAQHCASCHTGAYFTDSAAGNPTLDLCGTVVLHDIGTCDTAADGGYADQASFTYDGGCARTACMFDTPSLRSIFATAPYFHDGRAQTLDDAVSYMNGYLALGLSASDQADLVAYLKTL